MQIFPGFIHERSFAKQTLSLDLLPSGKSQSSLSGFRKIISAGVAGSVDTASSAPGGVV